MTRRNIILGTAVAVAASSMLLSGSGLADAAIPSAGDGSITACYTRTRAGYTGFLRVVDRDRVKCKKGEIQVAWNSKGIQGPAGPQGANGAPGSPGANGAPGSPGTKGDKGDPGTAGTNGAPGLKGDKGEPGLDGTNGAPGTNGTNGDPGIKGDKGEPGLDGTNGAPGTNGTNGDPGIKGDKGEPGLDGTNGAPGTNGTNGDPGIKGDKGDPGLNGTNGAPGTNGTNGDPGIKGDKGDPGVKGDKGDPGLDGTNGTNGAPGVKGDKGDPGVKGDKGDPGQPGPAGTTGFLSLSAATPGAIAQTADNTPVAIGLTAVAGSGADIASNTFTAPTTGWYEVGVRIDAATATTGNQARTNETCTVAAKINGTTTVVIAGETVTMAKNTDLVTTLQGSGLVQLTAGNTVTLVGGCTGNNLRLTSTAAGLVTFGRVF